MSDRALAQLAREAGLALHWTDAAGANRQVSADTQRGVLQALGLAANTERQIGDSLRALRCDARAEQPLTVVEAGKKIDLGLKGRSVELIDEQGRRSIARVEDGAVVAPSQIGYYQIDARRRLAVAPRRAWTMGEASRRKAWGVAAQVYSLRGSAGFGDFAALARFAEQAAAVGAQAVAISPVHALFLADLARCSPYSPSTRFFLNPLYGACPGVRPDKAAGLVDWPKAGARRLDALRAQFEQAQRDDRQCQSLRRFAEKGGDRLLAHARFETLDARFRAQGICDWRAWPHSYRDANSLAVRRLAARQEEIQFQFFLQWHADAGLADAQRRARAAGMAIGLIADMAVGVDPAGSHAWSAPQEMLRGLSIGAPPDLFTAKGQNWGLTSFSPQALRLTGYAGFVETLRAAMRHAGGIRLDHAMGLLRLWVVPDGAPASAGAYLSYPMADLMGLLALESRRHQAIVIAEDLGTVPPGFRRRIARAGLQGMRILWFERDGEGRFLPPERWDETAAALSTTHDLPTIAGWWRAGDLAWRRKLAIDKDGEPAKTRVGDRRALWRALKKARCAKGAMPSPQDVEPVADAVIRFLGKTECPLAILPIEDFVGEVEQPNLPGTVDGHPNWRRRLKSAEPFASPAVRRRVRDLSRCRQP